MSSSFIDLRRPQYPSSPEVLLSALAWATTLRTTDKQKVGLIYERRPGSGVPKVHIEPTKPADETLTKFCDELRAAGLVDNDGKVPQAIGQAVANSLEGALPLKGVGFASSAVGIAGALLQDPVGGLGVQSPPNFAQLINTIYSLGASASTHTAATRWFEAASFHAKSRPLAAIEQALVTSVLAPYLQNASPWPPSSAIVSEVAQASTAPTWWVDDVLEQKLAVPFTWFRTAWDRLCSPEWYEQLPPRRWASWSVCLLRHALAFTFLWEANFFYEIAKGVVDDSNPPETVARWALVPVRPLIPYRTGTITQMDVQPTLRRMLEIGLGCMRSLHAILENEDVNFSSLAELVEHMRTGTNSTQREQIILGLSGAGDTSGMNNLLETVRYSILARESEDQPDNYGLLRTVARRFYHVAPGPEWIVVMTAMSASGPGAIVRLGDLIQGLKGLGFQPRIDFLLSQLERAGLCASAPDGDEGIEINLGFGGE
jgi:hypothetical protein